MVVRPIRPYLHPSSLVPLEGVRKNRGQQYEPRRKFFFRSPRMGKKLYVGNLGYSVTDSDLAKMFEAHGTVESAQVIIDRDTGRSKGFGFVEMKTDQEAQAAIAALNGQDSGGRALTVNEARPREERGPRGGGGGGGRGCDGGCCGGGGRRCSVHRLTDPRSHVGARTYSS